MPAQAKTICHIFKSNAAQSQFDFYVQAIEDTYQVTVDGQASTDFQPQGTFNGAGWRIGFSEPIAANTEVRVTFDAKDYPGEPDPEPSQAAEPAPDSDPPPATSEPQQAAS